MTITRAEATREEFVRLVRARPFEPFAITFENGERMIVRHPENIAFDPTEKGNVHFYVIGDKLRTAGVLDAVSTTSTLDRADI